MSAGAQKMGEHGSWMDEWGACRACGGEIPHGHSDNCDVFKMERRIYALETAAKAVTETRREGHTEHCRCDICKLHLTLTGPQ